MFRSRFFWKLYLGFFSLIVLTAVVVDFLHGRQIDLDARAETQTRLGGSAHILEELSRPVLAAGNYNPAFQERIRKLGAATGIRFTVIHGDGRVMADSEEEPGRMDLHDRRPEVLEARETSRPATLDRFSATLSQWMTYVAVPVTEGDKVLGFARTARAQVDLKADTARLRRRVLFGVIVVVGIGGLVALLLARRVTARLQSVTTLAEAMASGELDQRVGPIGSDEFGTLERAFNTMAAQLSRRIDTIAMERTEVLAILKSMVEGVVAVDHDQHVVLINDRARLILGITEPEVTGRAIREVTRLQAVCDIVDLVIGGSPAAREEVALPMQGGDRHLELYANQLRDDKAGVTGAVVVLHEITGLRRLEQVRQDFVANVSHELKTPLTSIRGFVETLIDDEEAELGIRRRFLGKIRDQTHRLSALVADLLNLSKIESQGSRTERTRLDLRDAVRASTTLLLPRAEEKKLRIHLEQPDHSVPVLGDMEMIRQAVDNLLDNAIKYTPEGGAIWLRLRTENDVAIFEVQDSGVGLEPQHLQRIFERFYRVDRARSRELGGTGLGLSIVKHVALVHQGQVSVESTPGEGSTFRIELPVAAAEVVPAEDRA